MTNPDFYPIELKALVPTSNREMDSQSSYVYQHRLNIGYYHRFFDNLPTFAQVLHGK